MNNYRIPTDYAPRPRFHVGDVVDLGQSGHAVVERVTDCCTACRPIADETEKSVQFTPRFADKPVTFTAKPRPRDLLRISNQAEIPILRRVTA